MRELLTRAFEQVPGCIAAAVADSRGGVHAALPDTPSVVEKLELAAAAASCLFDASRVTHAVSPEAADAPSNELPREAVIVAADELHVFQRWNEDLVLIAVCTLDPRFLGKILSETRHLLSEARSATR
ncbi:hypothetical protein [Vulgatibacter incomptus]|uniref:Roadblock/LAMTOR2 domain-containing protein n=1 Tax=Vulgatibacter incomptus TaxID=1391653 RepID=A0A0K1PAF2_9BACT|nr:hypothetical protein [Vulgatibacter incomptus]AKU90094.1 hypothetical protein AKJ08_0481 [Vulgatibacter incomptus]